MISVNSHGVENFAELLHHYYQALAPDFGCSNAEKDEWQALPANERRRLVAATRLALMETESSRLARTK